MSETDREGDGSDVKYSSATEPEECPVCGAKIIHSRTDESAKNPIYDGREGVQAFVYGCTSEPQHTVTDDGRVWSSRREEFVDPGEFERDAEDLMEEAIAVQMEDTTVQDLWEDERGESDRW